MEKWIIAIGLTNLAGVVAAYFIGIGKSRGYTDRRLEEYDEQAKLFWKHINNRNIHEASMDSKLIESKFEFVNQKVAALAADLSEVKADTKATARSVQDLRNQMPEIMSKALSIYDKGANT